MCLNVLTNLLKQFRTNLKNFSILPFLCICTLNIKLLHEFEYQLKLNKKLTKNVKTMIIKTSIHIKYSVISKEIHFKAGFIELAMAII